MYTNVNDICNAIRFTRICETTVRSKLKLEHKERDINATVK